VRMEPVGDVERDRRARIELRGRDDGDVRHGVVRTYGSGNVARSGRNWRAARAGRTASASRRDGGAGHEYEREGDG
jgi:hypothetical protein